MACILYHLTFAESFFHALFIDGEVAYFTTTCQEITGDILRQAQEAFIQMLRGQGKIMFLTYNVVDLYRKFKALKIIHLLSYMQFKRTCTLLSFTPPGVCLDQNGQELCDIEDVRIECGPADDTVRGKRSAEASNELKVRFRFKMPAESRLHSDCKAKCDRTSSVVLFDDCYNNCEMKIEDQRVDTMRNVSARINSALNSAETVVSHSQRQPTISRMSDTSMRSLSNNHKVQLSSDVCFSHIFETFNKISIIFINKYFMLKTKLIFYI